MAEARSSVSPAGMAMVELRRESGRGRRRPPRALGFAGALASPSASGGAVAGGGDEDDEGGVVVMR